MNSSVGLNLRVVVVFDIVHEIVQSRLIFHGDIKVFISVAGQVKRIFAHLVQVPQTAWEADLRAPQKPLRRALLRYDADRTLLLEALQQQEACLL